MRRTGFTAPVDWSTETSGKEPILLDDQTLGNPRQQQLLDQHVGPTERRARDRGAVRALEEPRRRGGRRRRVRTHRAGADGQPTPLVVFEPGEPARVFPPAPGFEAAAVGAQTLRCAAPGRAGDDDRPTARRRQPTFREEPTGGAASARSVPPPPPSRPRTPHPRTRRRRPGNPSPCTARSSPASRPSRRRRRETPPAWRPAERRRRCRWRRRAKLTPAEALCPRQRPDGATTTTRLNGFGTDRGRPATTRRVTRTTRTTPRRRRAPV